MENLSYPTHVHVVALVSATMRTAWRSTQHSQKKTHGKQHTFRSMSGKDKQPDYVFIDKRSIRYCTDAEANDMFHLESDHRSVAAHFRFPRVKKKGGLDNKYRKQNLCTKTRYTRQSASTETREDPEPSEKSRKSSEEMMNLRRGSLASMKQQHTRRRKYFSSSTRRRRRQQHREETIDSKDQELAPFEKRKIWTEKKRPTGETSARRSKKE